MKLPWRLLNWSARIGRWCMEQRMELWGPLLIVVALEFLLFGCAEQKIRWIGGTFQIFGVLLVAMGLVGLRKLFNVPSFWQELKKAFAQFPPFRKHSVLQAGTGIYSVSGANVSAWSSVKFNSAASLPDRVATLEASHSGLHEEVGRLVREIDAKMASSKHELDAEVKARAAEITRIDGRLTEAIVGDINLDRLGVLCIFIGIILSTISPEWPSCAAR